MSGRLRKKDNFGIPGNYWRRAFTAVLLSAAAILTGCPKNGPKTVVRDRFDYNSAIGDSLKDQMLMNIVKLRYLDMPVFVEVAQIINGYEFQGSASVSTSLLKDVDGDALGAGVSGSYTNRPTITYTPLTSNQYVRGLMTPLPPEVVFFTIESGYAADLIMQTTVSSINGLRNDSATEEGGLNRGDADFFKATALLRVLQQAGAVSLFVRVKPDKERVPIISFITENQPPAVLSAVAEIKRLLRLDSNANEFRLIFGARAAENTEIALQTRSLIQIMGALAGLVEVPPENAAQAVAVKSSSPGRPQIFRVTSSEKRPRGAFVAIHYREHWYWIDDRDLKSKRVFALILLLFSMSDSKAGDNLPVLTIPVN